MTTSDLVRVWVRLYTSGLPAGLRDERRAEIESDLWEHQSHSRLENQRAMGLSMVMLARCLAGVPADLSWRASQANRKQRRDVFMPNVLLGRWWQAFSLVVAASTIYFGIRQLVTDEISEEVTVGKVSALIGALVFGGLILAGLRVFRSNPRRGAGMVLVGLAPVALLGGLGIGLVAGLILALANGDGWWWLPAALASLVATLAGLGAFGAWWNASPLAPVPSLRPMMGPILLLVLGVLGIGFGVTTGMTVVAVVGLVVFGVGVMSWIRMRPKPSA